MQAYLLQINDDLSRRRSGTVCVRLFAFALLFMSFQTTVFCQKVKAAGGKAATAQLSATMKDHEVASRFAPVFYQGLGDHPRGDYITNFDFDGDWRGDNNWEHAADARFPRKAYVYYSVSETPTHYLIHYAVFHPIDYKGGMSRGALLSEAITESVRRAGKYDPTGLSGQAVLAHENDMEGCLIVVEKRGAGIESAEVTMVETLAHDRFLKYVTKESPLKGFAQVSVEDNRAQLYVEPKGHGISANIPAAGQSRRSTLLKYHFTGEAGSPEETQGDAVGYELVPLSATLWPRAKKGLNETYGEAQTYSLSVTGVSSGGRASTRKVNLTVGSAFRGKTGAPNKARPPWGWFDREEAAAAAGEWFFDPARTVKRHFAQDNNFSTVYIHAPFMGINRK